MKVKIYEERNEVEASLTKGYLSSFGIDSTYSPGNNSLGLNPMVNRGPNKIFDIFVEEKDKQEATELLDERNINNK